MIYISGKNTLFTTTAVNQKYDLQRPIQKVYYGTNLVWSRPSCRLSLDQIKAINWDLPVNMNSNYSGLSGTNYNNLWVSSTGINCLPLEYYANADCLFDKTWKGLSFNNGELACTETTSITSINTNIFNEMLLQAYNGQNLFRNMTDIKTFPSMYYGIYHNWDNIFNNAKNLTGDVHLYASFNKSEYTQDTINYSCSHGKLQCYWGIEHDEYFNQLTGYRYCCNGWRFGRSGSWDVNDGAAPIYSYSDLRYSDTIYMNNAFRNTNITKFTIEGDIGGRSFNSQFENTFQDCYNLTDVNIGDSRVDICNLHGTFYNCYNLKNVNIQIGNNFKSSPYAFYNCSNLNNINLPWFNVFWMPYAFYNCTNLTGSGISKKTPYIWSSWPVTNIAYAFYNCTKLNNDFSIMTSSLGPGPGTMFYTNYYGFMYNNSNATYAFGNCYNLTSIGMESTYIMTIYNNVNASYMFFNCTNLNCNWNIKINYGNCSLSNMFFNCKFPENMTGQNIDNNLFALKIAGESSDTPIGNINISNMFRMAKNLTGGNNLSIMLDMSANVANVNAAFMFYGVNNLHIKGTSNSSYGTSLYLPYGNYTNAFAYTNVDLSWITANLNRGNSNISRAFVNCKIEQFGILTSSEYHAPIGYNIFRNCKVLERLNHINIFDYAYNTFENCYNLRLDKAIGQSTSSAYSNNVLNCDYKWSNCCLKHAFGLWDSLNTLIIPKNATGDATNRNYILSNLHGYNNAVWCNISGVANLRVYFYNNNTLYVNYYNQFKKAWHNHSIKIYNNKGQSGYAYLKLYGV